MNSKFAPDYYDENMWRKKRKKSDQQIMILSGSVKITVFRNENDFEKCEISDTLWMVQIMVYFRKNNLVLFFSVLYLTTEIN